MKLLRAGRGGMEARKTYLRLAEAAENDATLRMLFYAPDGRPYTLREVQQLLAIACPDEG